MRLLRVADLIDPPSIQRLVGVAMDVLIVAAIATMRIDALRSFFVPIVLLIGGAAAWSTFCLLVLAPRVLPRAYWFELGLLNYGFSTANTPQGFMLLRIVDPELKSGAAEDYAVAAPLSAPFVGGGVITFMLPWALQQVGAVAVLAAAVVLIACGCAAALIMAPDRSSISPDALPRPPSPWGEGGGEGA
jgi:ESS family glutamate:Na+ symporter